MSNEVTIAKKKVPFSAYMTADVITKKVNSIIGDKKEGAKFISNIVASVQANPMLQECSNQSILSCALVAHSLNLSANPTLGQIYMIPYNNKQTGVKEAQIQLSYKSYIQLCIRSGYYKKINALAIKEGELIKYDPLTEEIEVKLIEDEEERENAPIAGFYAMFEYQNGFKKAIYWSNKKMLSHADKYSQSFNKKTYDDIQTGKIPQKDMWKYSSPWYGQYELMGIKTVLKQLLSKYGILSIEMQEAIEKDQSVIKEDGTAIYVDNDNEDYVINTQIREVVENDVSRETSGEIKGLDDID